MSRKPSEPKTNSTEAKPRKQRVAHDHSNDYAFFMMQNIPNSSVVAVRRDKTIVAVYAVNREFQSGFTKVNENTMAFALMMSSIKQRGGLESFATLRSAGELYSTSLKEIARALFLTLPADVQFMTQETSEALNVQPELASNTQQKTAEEAPTTPDTQTKNNSNGRAQTEAEPEEDSPYMALPKKIIDG